VTQLVVRGHLAEEPFDRGRQGDHRATSKLAARTIQVVSCPESPCSARKPKSAHKAGALFCCDVKPIAP
jgi:hypothetical protein